MSGKKPDNQQWSLKLLNYVRKSVILR